MILTDLFICLFHVWNFQSHWITERHAGVFSTRSLCYFTDVGLESVTNSQGKRILNERSWFWTSSV